MYCNISSNFKIICFLVINRSYNFFNVLNKDHPVCLLNIAPINNIAIWSDYPCIWFWLLHNFSKLKFEFSFISFLKWPWCIFPVFWKYFYLPSFKKTVNTIKICGTPFITNTVPHLIIETLLTLSTIFFNISDLKYLALRLRVANIPVISPFSSSLVNLKLESISLFEDFQQFHSNLVSFPTFV